MKVIPNHILFEEVAERVANGESVTIPLKGRSMEPLLKTGDLLTLVGVTEPLRVGDVVLFRYRGDYVLHRVAAIDGDNIVAQGDACSTQEHCTVADVVARLVAVRHPDGSEIHCTDAAWHSASRQVLRRRNRRQRIRHCFDAQSRKRLAPWYFLALAVLMWAPLGGVPLDNFLLGIRLDHLLHASVYIPCTWFLMDKVLHFERGSVSNRRKALLLLCGCMVAVLTEGVQYLLPYRGFDINDMIANIFGVTLGWLLCLSISLRR